MQIAHQVQENAAGRWLWIAVGQEGGVMRSFESSPVDFETEAEARQDLTQHLECEMVHPRLIRSTAQLTNLINIAAGKCAACGGATFSNIQWHEPDNSGCNWNIEYINASDVSECMDAVLPVLEQLRHAYNIPNPI